MKFKHLFNFVMALMVAQFLFSCSSAEYYRFSAVQEPYKKVKAKPTPATEEQKENITLAKVAPQPEINFTDNEPVLEVNAKATTPVIIKTSKPSLVNTPTNANQVNLPEKQDKTLGEAEILAMAQARLANSTKAEKKELKKSLKDVLQQSAASDVNVVELVLAVLLPPLAVYLHQDATDTKFWISLILTILFFVPGIIFALLVVTDTI